ncbi:TRS130 [Candida jiufengensis]|uniref:TRS130 n=1 Tax=Candida jiufengensis TaxID=497108 RepID=UPI0022248ED7|nr:TRS130 [Candida jiufengensis]KAI5954977.1 TRS130 [Candida jiufengensis]
MSNDSIRIGYYDPFGIYPKIEDEVKLHLPLSNLHIRLNSNQPFKTVNKLQIQFVEEVPKKGDYLNNNDLKTYVRLMFVQIDSLEKYRGQVRPLIREWLKNLVLKTNCSWMIILYIPQDFKDKSSNLIKTSFFDKLQKDFGVDGKELGTILPTGRKFDEGNEKIFKFKDNVNEFMVQLKTLLLNSFVERFKKYNDLINQRKIHNIERFLTKLELCNLFKDMILLQDALIINEQLSEELFEVYEYNQDRFVTDKSDISSQDLTHYNFETSINEEEIKSQLSNNESINYLNLRTLIFIHESQILQEQAKLSTTNSLASKQISRLYKNLMLFLNDLVENNYEVQYLIIDTYLNLPIMEELIKPSTEDDSYLTDILEMRAELKLFKRSVISKIAESQNLHIEGLRDMFEEISLDDDKEPNEKSLNIQTKELLDITFSKESYIKTFQELTEEIMEDLVKCNRVKTIDILSIDLAIINYEIKNYQECLNTLQNSYEYFIENSWTFLGGILLEIYLGCIENLNEDGVNNKEILINCINLLKCLIKNQNSIDINSYQKIKNTNQISKIFDKIDEKSLTIDEEKLEFDLSDFFKTKVKPFVYADDSTDKDVYYIEVEIKNAFHVSVEFLLIQLDLVDEKHTAIEFSNAKVQLNSSSEFQKFKLFTRNIKFGLFSCSHLKISLNPKLTFTKNFNQEKSSLPDTSIFDDTVIEPNKSITSFPTNTYLKNNNDNILIYQNLQKFRAQFFNVRKLNLGSHEVMLELQNLKHDLKEIKIDLFSSTTDLTFIQSHLEIENLKANELKHIIIPFKDIHESKIVNMEAKITYMIDEEQYSLTISYNVNISLSISVSVQDIFKTEFIYSKFQVGTINSKIPIKIISQDLQNEDFEIQSPTSANFENVIAFGEQPIIFFYKIFPKHNHKINDNDKLKLTIAYTNLRDECDEIIYRIILEELETLNLVNYWYLIKDVLLSKLKFDLNNFTINDNLIIINFIEFQIFSNKIIERYIRNISDQIKIKNLFVDKFSDPISTSQIKIKEDSIKNILTINVAVPVLQYLQVIEYEYEKQQYIVGEPIILKLKIKTLTKWSEDNNVNILGSSSPTRSSQSPAPQLPIEEEFQLCIHNDDNWLISGFKKHQFTFTSKNNLVVNDLILIPLTVGKLTLPKISIKMFDTFSNNFINSNNLDIEFVNGSESILVIPDVNNITFSF